MEQLPKIVISVLGTMAVLAVIVTFVAPLVQKFSGGTRRGFRNRLASPGDPATEIARIDAKDRADARALYERITNDKLEVIKTALAMGYNHNDLKDLDDRLEGLIGSEKLHNLLESDSPTAPSTAA